MSSQESTASTLNILNIDPLDASQDTLVEEKSSVPDENDADVLKQVLN